ncbi:hypothetical protein Adt_20671 [Abeliophyllum distichum]|uniref:Uncharacterized protein n=1 Tax=Abeliophyllum distichum TaxID=126358 RepID=A0ABD1SX65_9LAMI
MERIKADRIEAEAKAVAAYQKGLRTCRSTCLLKFLMISGAGSQCPDDQMCSSCVPDPWRISMVGLNGGYLEDPYLDDEANNYPQLVLIMPDGSLLSPVMILQKEKTVIGGMQLSNL